MKSLRILPICLAAVALPLAFAGCNKGSDMSAPATADTNATAAPAAPAPADTSAAPAAPAPATPAPAAADTNAPATNAAPAGT